MNKTLVANAIHTFIGVMLPPNHAAGRWARGEEDIPPVGRPTKRCKVCFNFFYTV
jgi:hypothetical protein